MRRPESQLRIIATELFRHWMLSFKESPFYMKHKLINIWTILTISFWFVPGVIIAIAVLLAFVFVHIDANHDIKFQGILNYLTTGGAEGARAVLSTIASSMMTIAGITFSITIVTLTLASSQLGPRVIRNFIKSKLNQIVLGTYVATFVYCLLVLRTVTDNNDIEFIPNISLAFAMLLAIGNILLLVIFIHHVATLIQADNVISNLSAELEDKINVLFPESIGHDHQDVSMEQPATYGNDDFMVTTVLPSRKSNYLNSIATDKILDIAITHDLCIEFTFRPGQFVIKDTAFISLYSNKPLDEDVKEQIYDCCQFAKQRSPAQDSAFVILQIVEIATRALSPGINDPFTAITCIDRLAASICLLSERKFPRGCRYDDQGRLRVKVHAITFADLTDAAFNQIRQYGQTHADILIRLMDTFLTMAELIKSPFQRDVIFRHATMVNRACQKNISEVHEIERLKESYLRLLLKLGRREVAN